MEGLSPQERALLPLALRGGQVLGFEAARRMTPQEQGTAIGAALLGLFALILMGRPRPE